MEWIGLNDLREKYLSFFESKGHLRLPSASLIPQGDNSLLLIAAGMVPFKKYFTGVETPPSKRVTTCQKCVRTPDIERVGKTARHGTYFEMLGNFSFGDYFKEDATAWAWEFVTEILKMPVDRLWVSIYEDDDEAFKIWTQHRGVSPKRIVRMGKEDNFWEHGAGPCGPCSEIYFDRGPDHGCQSPDCHVGCDCDRFVEFWNLVFTQFECDGNGHYDPLPNPNIDTGMGLERLAAIMQGVDNLFEVDTIRNIMKHVSELCGVEYGASEKTDVSLRVVTDHIRSTVFLVGDGVLPSNEGRGYVLRRLLRRGARHGRLLGMHEPFLYKVCDTVIAENRTAYPELAEKAEYIRRVIRMEEERFGKTVDQGMELLGRLVDRIESRFTEGKRILDAGEAFRLYDTFGFPIDLTREIIAEHRIEVDENAFARLMDEQRQRARSARDQNSREGWSDELSGLVSGLKTHFAGYDQHTCEAKVLCILKDGQKVEEAEDGDTVDVVFDQTVFYTESGGQVSDTGIVKTGSAVIEIDGSKKAGECVVHFGRVVNGTFSVGEQATLAYHLPRREAIRRNHTAVHLTQAALRRILGDHVQQAGSHVDETRMRFDFSHFSALSHEELARVELAVNEQILKGLPVVTQEMGIEEAKASGAMALFGEKYGDRVRVVRAGDFSVELCGGCHVDNTAKIGLFKIVSESSVAAGVRRIEGVTGHGVLAMLGHLRQTVTDASFNLRCAPEELVAKTEHIIDEFREKGRKIDELNQKIANSQIDGLFETAREICGVKFMHASFSEISVATLRAMGDRIRDNRSDIVAALATVEDGKGKLLVVCGKDAIAKGLSAGKIVKEIAALAGGNGGGRPDSAMAGVPNIFQIDEALIQAPSILARMLHS